MAVNIKDIAREAGVSIATVSRVINGNRQVRPEIRKRVEEVLSKNHYVPNTAARNLVLGREPARVVLVTLPPILSPFFAEMLSGVREGLRDRGFNLVLQEAFRPESGEHILANLEKYGLVGMLVFCRDLSPAERRYLRARKIPYLLLDYLSKDDHSFAVDNTLGGRMAAEWLQKREVRKPIYLGPPPTGGGVSEKRWRGFSECYQKRGQMPLLQSVDVDGTSTDFMRKGYQLTRQFFSSSSSEGVDGVFYFCDEMALGGVKALRELQIAVPVVGFDGWEPASYLGIATLVQPARQIGIDGARLLTEELTRNPPEVINKLYAPTLREPLAERF